MSHSLPNPMPLVEAGAHATCKCCGATAAWFGAADFHTSCERRRGVTFQPSGVLIPYYRCPACGFMFTTAFDRFTVDDFKKWIYNDQYLLVDPDYAELRPTEASKGFVKLMRSHRAVRVLDYGSGNGLLGAKIREAGFDDVVCYDPFVGVASARPQGRFDVILCVEVIEHSPQPVQTLAEMVAMLSDSGVILITTMLQPNDIDRLGIDWWYIAPRNGHVSLFSARSVNVLADRFGLHFGSWDDETHLLCRTLPDFARHWMNPP